MDMRMLVDFYNQIQKVRVGMGNRVGAIERGADDHDVESMGRFGDWADMLEKMEHEIVKEMSGQLDNHPAWPWLKEVRGVGPTLAAKLVALIGDISTFDTVSKLWRFAGYAVIDGQRERPTKGEQLHYSIRLKTTIYLIAESFLRSGSPYRKIYDDAKEYYQVNRPEWQKGHIHMASMRKMSKIFLSHLWQVWREEEGLPTRLPYVHEKLGHTTMWEVAEFTPDYYAED